MCACSKSCRIWTRNVLFGILAQGNLTTGRVFAGNMSAAGEGNYNYTDQDGNARSIAELNADSIQLLTPRNAIASGTPYASQPEQQQGAPADNFEGDDDLPF